MVESSLVTYKSESKNKKIGVKEKISKNFNIQSLLGFFFSLSVIYGNMTPFGLAFLTLERNFKKSTVITLVSVVFGSIMLESRVLSAKYITAELIYFAVLFVLEKDVKLSFKVSMACALVSLLLSGSIVLYWQGLTLYTVVELIIELFFTAGGIFVFDKCMKVFKDSDRRYSDLNASDRVYLCIVSGILLLSLKNFYIGTSISIINVAAAALLMCISLGTSAQGATVYGVFIGMLCGIGTDYFLPLIGAYGFCGFLTGIFSRFGKSGSAVGLILANAVLVVYTNNAIEPMLKIYEILLSIIAIIFIPDGFINDIKHILELTTSDKEGIIRIKNNLKQKLKSASESLIVMVKTMERLTENRDNEETADISLMFDNAADKVCLKCKKSHICWGKNFNKTYREFYSLIEVMELKGCIDKDDISPLIKNNCINLEKILEELSVQYDSYRLKKIWKSKLEESRELAGQNLINMSKILDEIAADIDKRTSTISSDALRRELESKGLKPVSIDVCEDKTGKIKISFLIKKSSLKNGGEGRIFRCLKHACEKEMKMSVYESSRDGYMRVNATEREKYTVQKDFACASLDKRSGDNFKFYKLGCGKYIITLSDGMGTGEDAAKESKAVIELMDSFLHAGFDIKVAVKLINSVLLMKHENQSFATIDMCVIDLHTGNVEFIKTGAEPSYIKRNNEVVSVSGSSLPIGITAKTEPEIFKCNLNNGDIIVMASDGVQTKIGGDSWLKKFLEENASEYGVKGFAQKLLKKAEEINNGINDDMTVISVKLEEKAG